MVHNYYLFKLFKTQKLLFDADIQGKVFFSRAYYAGCKKTQRTFSSKEYLPSKKNVLSLFATFSIHLQTLFPQ